MYNNQRRTYFLSYSIIFYFPRFPVLFDKICNNEKTNDNFQEEDIFTSDW